MIIKNSLLLINIFFLLATVITIATTYPQREKKAIKYLILYSSFYALLTFFVINVFIWEDIPTKTIFSRLRYISFSFLPFIWFLCVNEIFDYWNWARKKIFICLVTLLCTISITLSLIPSLSFLFCYDFQPIVVEGVKTLQFKNGPWFNVHMTLSIIFYVMSAWICLKILFKTKSYQRIQALLLLISMLTCILDPILVYTGNELRWLMVSMIVFFINQITILICNYKFRLLDIFSVSPYQLLRELPDPLIIYDEKGIAITKNKKAIEYLKNEDNKHTIKELTKDLANGNFERVDLINPDNLEKHFFNASISSLTSHHQAKGHLLYLKDINEEHNFQKRLNTSLKETQTLLSFISHDVLGSISTLDNLSKKLHFNSQSEESGALSKGLSETKSLILDILNWGQNIQKLNSIQKTNENISALTKNTFLNTIDLHAITKKINFEHHIPHQQIMIPIDSELYKSVIRNIIINAVNACSDQGKISIHLSKRETDIVIKIKDTGSGLNVEQKNRIKEFLSQEETSLIAFKAGDRSGNGIGLSIIRRFLKTHNASFDLDSQEGIGTSFNIILPLVIPIE